MSGSATIVVIVARTKEKLKEAGATSEATAKTPSELDLNEKWLKMSAHAGVVATQDGRYYLTSKNKKQH
jgi:uroporphyrinogen-III synthase